MSGNNPVEWFWYSRSPLLYLFWPLHLIFLLIVLCKRALYQSGILSSVSFSKPVMVVGNLSVGGTGKTPFIASIVQSLIERGLSVGIVSRGYKASVTHFPHQVSEQDPVELVGDEAFMQFRKLAVPIVISPNRVEAVEYLLDNNQVDIVISDDGLQHYRMARDIEVVLYDGSRQFGNQMILPIGPLREPVSRLKSVDYVIQNGLQSSRYTKHKTTLLEICLVNIETKQELTLDYLSDKEVVAVAGIGNPGRFFESLEKHAMIRSRTIYPDHHAFRIEDFDHVHEDKVVVMTEKDAVKCEAFAKKNWYYLKVEMQLDNLLVTKIEDEIRSIKIEQKTESKPSQQTE